jgi:hypothetical protein
MSNWMINLKTVCIVCLGQPPVYQKFGKRNIQIACKTCNGKHYIEKQISIADLITIINDIQDGYSASLINNIIDAIKDGYH